MCVCVWVCVCVCVRERQSESENVCELEFFACESKWVRYIYKEKRERVWV